MFRVEENIEGKMKGMLKNDNPFVNRYFHENNHPDMFMGFPSSTIDAKSFSGGFDSVENGSSSSSLTFLTPFDAAQNHEALNLNARFLSSGLVSNPKKQCMLNVPYELGLCENLQRMHIGDDHRNYCNKSKFRADPDGFLVGFDDPLSCAVGKDGFYGYSLGLRQGCDASDSMGPFPSLSQMNLNAVYNDNQGVFDMRLRKDQGRGYCSQGIQPQISPLINDIDRSLIGESFYNTQHYGIVDSSDLHSSQLINPMLELDLGCKLPILKQKARVIPNDGFNLYPPLLSTLNTEEAGARSCEDSFIVDGKCPRSAVDKKSNHSKGQKKKSRNEITMARLHEKELASDGLSKCRGVCKSSLMNGQTQCKGLCENDTVLGNSNPMFTQPIYGSLTELKGYIYSISKHQLGCRFLQRIFDEGSSQDVQILFSEIIDHVVELMLDPFGNYLIQKLLDVCSEEQKLQVVLMVTKTRGELVSICLDTHGTRVVQKLIETIKSRQQISLVMIALKPGLLSLMKDLNGNHVIQRCLQCLSNENNKFILDAAAKFCVDIACHRHGCCVLNRCITHSSGLHREKLVTSICANGVLLSLDAFGNYVIQHIIELKVPYAAATLLSLFEGQYVYLSMQKFSSHVVEKFLRCIEESQPRIIHELLSVPHFDQLLQDRFANYVIQSALEVSKGSLHALLVEAVRPYEILRTSPYCKKIFSRNLLKK